MTGAVNTGVMMTTVVNLLLVSMTPVAKWQTKSSPLKIKCRHCLLSDSSDQQFQISFIMFNSSIYIERIVYSIAGNSVKALRTII